MSDTVDNQLVQLVNNTYGISVRNSTPNISGVKISKIRADHVNIGDMWINGKVQTELRLTQQITTDSGDLILTSATGRVNMSGASIINYTTEAQSRSDLIYGTVLDPSPNNLRLYADTTGRFAWKPSTGISTIIDSSALTASRIFTFPNVAGTIILDNQVNQDLRTTASPTFAALNLTNGISAFGGNVYESSGTNSIAASGANVTVVTLPTTSNHSYLIEFCITGFVTAGTNVGKANFQRTLNGITNNAGVMDIDAFFSNSFTLNGIPTAGQSVTASGTNVIIALMGNTVDDIRFRWWVKIYAN